MKYLLVLTLLTTACSDTVVISKEEYAKLTETRDSFPTLVVGAIDPNRTKNQFIIEQGSDGHDYANNKGAAYDAYVCFHYINCRKCTKQDTLNLQVTKTR